jgi:hypothetical protein
MTKCMNDTSGPARNPKSKKKPQTREERLAEALRNNLRRRKAPRGTESDTGMGAEPDTEKPQDES